MLFAIGYVENSVEIVNSSVLYKIRKIYYFLKSERWRFLYSKGERLVTFLKKLASRCDVTNRVIAVF
jgi:hypothetical protein